MKKHIRTPSEIEGALRYQALLKGVPSGQPPEPKVQAELFKILVTLGICEHELKNFRVPPVAA